MENSRSKPDLSYGMTKKEYDEFVARAGHSPTQDPPQPAYYGRVHLSRLAPRQAHFYEKKPHTAKPTGEAAHPLDPLREELPADMPMIAESELDPDDLSEDSPPLY